MEQILFLFDLDQILPLEGSVDEEDQECRLNYVKEACLRIFFRETQAAKKDKNVLPHFGFRFFSSTDYHPSGEQQAGHFKQVSTDTFSEMETALEDRFRTITQNAVRQNNLNPNYFSTYLRQKGHRSPSEKIRSSLEEAVVLFDWDRPTITSPVKSKSNESDENGNQVYLVTRIPASKEQFQVFLPSTGKLPTHRDFTQALFSKNVKSVFSGYLKICLNILDTSCFFSDPQADANLRSELERSIKAYRGSLISLDSLCAQLHATEDTVPPTASILQSGAGNPGLLPSSLVLRSMLTAANAKQPVDQPEAREMKLLLGDTLVRLECSASVSTNGIPECQGYFVRSLVNFKMNAKCSVTVTSDNEICQLLFKYLLFNNKCALLRTADAADTLLMSADSLNVGTLQQLETGDANFLALMFKLQKFKVESVDILDYVQDIPFSKLDRFPSDSQDPSRTNNRGFWDVNSFEAWRTRESAGFRFLDRMKHHRRTSEYKEVKLSRSRLRQQTREQYAMKEQSFNPSGSRELKRRSSELQDRLMHDIELESRIQRGKTMSKHLSEISNVSSASRSSRSSGIGTWSSSGAPDGESDMSSIQIIGEMKAGKAMAILNEMLETQDLTDSEGLVAHLTSRKEKMVESEDQDPISLAGFAESCVSIILQHLDTAGIPKTNLEEFVSDHFLLAVGQVSTRYSTQNEFKLNEHKIQTLLLGETLWLLANKDTISKFEDSMLDHLRQISFHDSPRAMASFLKEVLLPCYINKQDNLLCVLYDELDQDRPMELKQMFSPDPCSSTAPSSNTSLVSSVSSATFMQEPKDIDPVQKRIPMARHKSFDANLSRQIAVGKGGMRKSTKSMEVEKKLPTKKIGVKEKARKTVSTKRESARKAVVANKSPQKSVHQARRNLCFDKSPMKKMVSPTKKTTTPMKKGARKTPQKLTPGKRHRIIVPSTPTSKQVHRKSDGNRNVFDTPDKGHASKSILMEQSDNQKSFYRDNSSRNTRKYEESMNASLLSSTVSDPLFISREVADRQNRSINIFSQILDRKRKRDSTEDSQDELDNKMPKLTESGDSLRSRTRKRLISFSEQPARQQSSLKNKDPVTPSKNALLKLDDPFSPSDVIGNTPRKETTPRKVIIEESPFKKVSFNPAHLSATPRREGHVAKSILKTPSKTPDKDWGAASHGAKPVITPVRSAMTLSYTPKKSPAARRDISSPGGKSLRMLRVSTSDSTASKQSSLDTSKDYLVPGTNTTPQKHIPIEEKTSPIITSSKKKKKKNSQDSLSSVSDLCGFPTPSPTRLRDVGVGVSNVMKKIKISPDKPVINAQKKYLPTKELDLLEMCMFEPLPSSPMKPSASRSESNRRSSPRAKNSGSNEREIVIKTSDAREASKTMMMLANELDDTTNVGTRGTDNAVSEITEASSRPVPNFTEDTSEDVQRRTSPRKNAGKRRNAETSMLDDKLTQYFSPKSRKRVAKPREDIQDNMAIANALLKRSPKKKLAKSSKPATPLSFESDAGSGKGAGASPTKHYAVNLQEKLQDEFAFHATPAHDNIGENKKKVEAKLDTAKSAASSLQPKHDAAIKKPGSESIRRGSWSSADSRKTAAERSDDNRRAVKRSSLVIESKSIETPDSELAFDLNASREQTESVPDQSSDFYQCSTCKQSFVDKREYISHYKVCLLSSNTGVLFDKVKEKKSEEEEETDGNAKNQSGNVKRNSKSSKKKSNKRNSKRNESEDESDADWEKHEKDLKSESSSDTMSKKSKKAKVDNEKGHELSDSQALDRNKKGSSKTKRKENDATLRPDISKPMEDLESKPNSRRLSKSRKTKGKEENKTKEDQDLVSIEAGVNSNFDGDDMKPVNSDNIGTPSRRSVRSRAPVSYEEADIDGLFSPKKGGVTPGASESDATPADATGSRLPRKKYILNSENRTDQDHKIEKNVNNVVSGNGAVRHLGREITRTSRGTARQSKVVTVKTMNTSQEEIVDMEETISPCGEYKSPTPDKMGKFFSIGKIVETPDGKFTIRLNRVAKPSGVEMKHGSPALRPSDKSSSKGTPVKESKSKSSSRTSTPTISLFPTRISRSAAKDIGVSPSKLQKMIMYSPTRKSEHVMPDTPDKENLPKTPKIRFKRIKTSSALCDSQDRWTSETIISPVKNSPVKRPGLSPMKRSVISLDNLTSTSPAKRSKVEESVNPGRSDKLCVSGSPARGWTGAGLSAHSFSPLSSSSIHKLHTSPLVHQQMEPTKKEERRKGKRVNKQLYN